LWGLSIFPLGHQYRLTYSVVKGKVLIRHAKKTIDVSVGESVFPGWEIEQESTA